MADKAKSGLDLLREPFAANHISKLPKPTKSQTDAVKANFKAGIRCTLCGAWHHPDVVHLDYVGHAALTDRLLDADPNWAWEPAALSDGLPAFDNSGGLWIRLTVCGVTRLGYGHAAAKPNQDPGAREKEVIGDALRNAAMRFGAALDLWHKGDLHADEVPAEQANGGVVERHTEAIRAAQSKDALRTAWDAALTDKKAGLIPDIKQQQALVAERDTALARIDAAEADPFPGEIVPYANDPTDPGGQFDQMEREQAA
jgi:hypothetical protein